MPTSERGSLRAAFSNFNRADADKEAERKLLGRVVDAPPDETLSTNSEVLGSYHPATRSSPPSGLTPKPLLQREAVRQLSFRCPVSLASELRTKAAFNQLEQQEIIIEGIKRVLSELGAPPEGWNA